MNIENDFIRTVIKRFETYKALGDKAFQQIDENDFFVKASSESNSIAIIVQHLNGNMLSRFTDFLTEDGEKSWRNRDQEFEEVLSTKDEVIDRWNQGWHCVLGALQNLRQEDLTATIYIRTEPLQVYDAILRQLAHYAHHVGQIVFIAKMLKDKNWQSLSIPKGESNQFNERMKRN